MTFVYPAIPMTSFLFPFPALEIFDYISIPIYSRKVMAIPSHSHSHWNKKSFKKNSYSSARVEEWFSLEWAHKIAL